MLFIDTQQYLDLYRMHTGKQLLSPLEAVKDQVFVTTQIADEVTRNKLDIACGFFTELFGGLSQEFKALNKGFPDHLFSDSVTEDLKRKLSNLKTGIESTKRAIDHAIGDLLQQIGRSQDEVSKALAAIFASSRSKRVGIESRPDAKGTRARSGEKG